MEWSGLHTSSTMTSQFKSPTLLLCILAFVFLFTSNVSLPGRAQTTPPPLLAGENPFTAKAALIRYWNRQIQPGNNLPKHPPPFLLSKASPLSAADSAFLITLADQNSLSDHLYSFCSLARLFCESSPLRLSSTNNGDSKDADFTVYTNKRFSNYGTSRLSGIDSFKNYSVGLNTPNHSFKTYSKDTTSHSETFSNYANDGNVANGSFASYGFGANGGSGEFKTYDPKVNIPNLLFTTYDSNVNNHPLSFSTYSADTNSGSQTFTSYAKHGNGVRDQFNSYSDDANTISSTFTGYDLLGNDGNQSFTNYGETGNDPHSNFKGYSTGANSATLSFGNYRNAANVGKNSFQSYARNANSAKVTFTNYGKSFNPGNDTFKEYGKGSKGQTTVTFKTYTTDRNFKDYIDKGVTFSGYANSSSGTSTVEKGRFFRESDLHEGNVIVMPDIRDKMPERPFLPRPILSRLPFSTARVSELKEMFHAEENSAMEHVITNALEECERPPSRDETKRCVGSAEDMIDFAVSVLGHNITVRTTETVYGSNRKVMVGPVKGVNGGRVTESVSCHQSLYPYLLYYCHSVPDVRVYEADIVDVVSQVKINRGVAICHLDTSAWSSGHGAFVALGYGPGQIEVCHWIFENDMTWTVVD